MLRAVNPFGEMKKKKPLGKETQKKIGCGDHDCCGASYFSVNLVAELEFEWCSGGVEVQFAT